MRIIRTEIQKLLKGDRLFLSQLIREQKVMLTQHIKANSGTQEDVSDLLQEALMVAYLKLKSKPELDCKLSTFVFAIAKRLWLNQLRKRKKEVPGSSIGHMEVYETYNVEESLDEYEIKKTYLRHFDMLKSICQKILKLFFEKHSMQEIVEQMGLSSVAFAKKKKFECKKALIESIQSDPNYPELKSTFKRFQL